jgi:hypothetical protein
VGRLRVGKWGSWVRSSRRVVADGVLGIAPIIELCKQLGVVGVLDSAGGSDEAAGSRTLGGTVVGRLAAAQLAGEDHHLVGSDRQREDAAGSGIDAGRGVVLDDCGWAGSAGSSLQGCGSVKRGCEGFQSRF